MKKLTLHNARSLFVTAVIAISTSAVSSAQYKFTTLSVPGSTSTTVMGINNNNLIAGYYQNAANNIYGFTYNPNTSVWKYPISDPQAPKDTYATATNTSGTLVGYYWVAGKDYGMMEQAGSKFSGVIPQGCTENTIVTGINDTGTMGGYCVNTGLNGQLQTVAWESYPTNVSFSCFGSTFTAASAVNNWLLMVGSVAQDNG